MADQAPARLGPYEVLSRLGEGAMGEVLRARDPRLGREVAIKLIRTGRERDPDRLRRFEAEARAIAALNHPNVLAIHDVGTHEGLPYLVTELLEGETLAERLLRGRAPIARAVALAAQVARGLAAAHGKGIVHRDLKPANLYVTRDGRVKILDFGLAKLGGAEESPAAGSTVAAPGTQPGTVLGSLGYMAPEQVRGEAADHRADVFAFGAVLYELLTGRRAFAGSTAVEIGYATISHDPVDPATLVPGLPPPLARLVARCLEKDPADRFQSAQDLAFALEALVVTPERPAAETDARPATRPPDAPRPPSDAPRPPSDAPRAPLDAPPAAEDAPGGRAPAARRVALAALALAGALLAGGAIGRLWSARPGARPGPAAGGTIAASAPAAPGASAPAAPSPAAARFTQLTFRRGSVHAARFAPDGRSVLYGAAWEGAPPQVFETIPGNPEARPVTSPGFDLLAVSATGELALLADARALSDHVRAGVLARGHLGGGEPRRTLDRVVSAAFLPDGSLAVSRWDPAARGGVGGGWLELPEGHVVYETAGILTFLRAAPTGDRIACLEYDLPGDDAGAVTVIGRDGARAVRGPRWPSAQGIAWSPDGRDVWVAAVDGSSSSDLRAVRRIDEAGTARVLLEAPSYLTLHDVAADGRALVGRVDWRASVRALAPGDTAERDLTWFSFSLAHDLSADGRTVLFHEWKGTPHGDVFTYLRRTDGSPAVRLIDGESFNGLSPDGRLVVNSPYPARDRLRLVPTGPGETRTLPAGPITRYLIWWWHPDGRRVLALARAGAETALWLHDASGGEPRRLPGSLLPRPHDRRPISPDGRWVVSATTAGGRTLQPLEDGGDGRPLPGLGAADAILAWTTDGRSLLVAADPWALPARIDRYDLATGRRSTWRSFVPADPAGDVYLSSFLVVPDGRAYAYTERRVVSELYLVPPIGPPAP